MKSRALEISPQKGWTSRAELAPPAPDPKTWATDLETNDDSLPYFWRVVREGGRPGREAKDGGERGREGSVSEVCE